jgi:hypothetical protein
MMTSTDKRRILFVVGARANFMKTAPNWPEYPVRADVSALPVSR